MIRCPDEVELCAMRPGAVLLSMMRLPTRPRRVELLLRGGIVGVSMDGIVDETGLRLVEDLEASRGTGRGRRSTGSGERTRGSRTPSVDRSTSRVSDRARGGWAVHASTRYGEPGLREELAVRQVPGVEVTVVDFDLTWHEDYMRARLGSTDLLIYATHRRDPTRPVVPNGWLAELPDDAVILDLAADPYDFAADPPYVKGIEGTPHRDLDQWAFEPDDPAYASLEGRVDTRARRFALSCYSWPGLEPARCMRRYGEQLEPIVELILGASPERWSATAGSHVERAVARAEVTR